MSVFHYDQTPTPVGWTVGMNGSDTSYGLGLYDGALYADQYADEPEESVLFESPDGARRWLAAVTAVLTPYIESGDNSPRIPDSYGWATDGDEADEKPPSLGGPLCPDCVAGKHAVCQGQAWDVEADAPTACACEHPA